MSTLDLARLHLLAEQAKGSKFSIDLDHPATPLLRYLINEGGLAALVDAVEKQSADAGRLRSALQRIRHESHWTTVHEIIDQALAGAKS